MRAHAVRTAFAAGLLLLAAACREASRSTLEVTAAAATAGEGPARLVADVRVRALAEGSSPRGFVASGGRLWFVADDGSSGRELWRTDGSGAGTELVSDLLPGGASSSPSSITAFEGGVLFAADDGARGAELWFADATGARLVKDVQPGSRGSSPHGFAVVGGTVFFAAETAAEGIELWRTDGTEAGTRLVMDILPGPASSSPASLTAFKGTLYFAADGGGGQGVELWKSDGTAAGTTGQDLLPGGSSSPSQLTAVADGRLFFAARTASNGVQLWSTNGVGAASVVNAAGIATNPTDPSLLTPSGTTLFYRAQKGGVWNLFSTLAGAPTPIQTQRTGGAIGPDVDASELLPSSLWLWVSGSVAGGPRQLLTLEGSQLVQLGSESPAELTEVNGTLLFAAGASGGRRLWQSDGTVAGTHGAAGTSGVVVGELAPLGSWVLFDGDDGASGAEPWRAEISESGVVSVPLAPLRNLRPDLGSSYPRDLAAFDGRLYFSADMGSLLDGTFIGRELWVTDPTTSATSLAWDVWFLADGRVGGLVDAGPLRPCGTPAGSSVCGGLLLAAFDESNGRELWRWDGAEATVPVLDIRAGAPSAAPVGLTRLGDEVLFAADDGTSGVELWKTDGSGPGTALVRDLLAGPGSSSPSGLTAVNGLLFFGASANGFDFAPFRSDGTAAGTVAIDAVAGLVDPVTAPAGFAPLGADVLFSAATGLVDDLGRELFRYDPAAGLTTRVADLAEGPASADPTPVVVHGAAGYFGAYDGTSVGLWRTDGFASGTALVRRLGLLGAGAVGSAVSVGGTLYFVGNDEANGPELWRSDGTEAGTALVEDVHPGPVGSVAGSVLFPLPSRGHVLYAADDGATGRELWISNGTALGTRLLQDLRPGPQSSNPDEFLLLGDRVYFSADDGAAGRELWVLDVSPAALDLTPPVPACLPVTREATGPDGARPTFSMTATDDVSPPDAISFSYAPEPGALFPLGSTSVLATAGDEAGNVAQCSFDLTVVDTTGPAMTCPVPPPTEATSAEGAAAVYAPALAVDLVDGASPVTYSRAAGSLFPLGDTPVTATGTDRSGNESACTFTVAVRDTTAPAVTCPADVTANATGFSGAAVTYEAATATDAVTAPAAIALSYDRASGGTFPLGTTTVTATGTDGAGNAGACTFAVTVVDATPPDVTCPGNVVAEATSPSGAAATWTPAAATDLETPSPVIGYSAAPGSTFPLGITVVTATATDLGGHTDSCTFTVTVADTTPPSVSCAGLDTIREASGPAGAAGGFPAAVASDAATAAVTVAYTIDVAGTPVAVTPASLFGLGTTSVLAVAADGSGNTSACPFTVTVRDTTAPLLACPAPVDVEATGPSGAPATFAATASDAVTAVVLVDYVVDAAGTPVAVSSGSTFAIGLTEVTAGAQDGAGNVSTCSFAVTVADRTAPTLVCPAGVSVEATGPDGAIVAFEAATASDAVTAEPAVSYSAASGARFPLGSSTVTASARDAAGNEGTCEIPVAVVDTTAPVIECPADVAVEARGPTAVDLPEATATDAVTPSPTIATSVASGSVFGEGTTLVRYTATDAAGNEATCTVGVTVTLLPPEEAGGCGCGSGSASGGSLALGALLVAVLRGRRRREGRAAAAG